MAWVITGGVDPDWVEGVIAPCGTDRFGAQVAHGSKQIIIRRRVAGGFVGFQAPRLLDGFEFGEIFNADILGGVRAIFECARCSMNC